MAARLPIVAYGIQNAADASGARSNQNKRQRPIQISYGGHVGDAPVLL
jgi:hypothetical protein